MQPKFWQERWESSQLGFHQSAINPLLDRYWASLEVPRDAHVFVPLCGKSLDMHWLREQGHSVFGIELSPIATRDFFTEADLDYTEREHGAFREFSADGFELLCGDFFDLEASDLANVVACYDRASLIALPPDLRRRYAAKMAEVLPRGARTLLLTIEYDQSKMSGPPHSVPPDEVETLFGDAFQVEKLESGRPEAPTPRFQERGLDLWAEHVFLLTRRDHDSPAPEPSN